MAGSHEGFQFDEGVVEVGPRDQGPMASELITHTDAEDRGPWMIVDGVLVRAGLVRAMEERGENVKGLDNYGYPIVG